MKPWKRERHAVTLSAGNMREGRKGMPTTPLLPLPDGLEIMTISASEQEVRIRVVSNRLSGACPRCSKSSGAIQMRFSVIIGESRWNCLVLGRSSTWICESRSSFVGRRNAPRKSSRNGFQHSLNHLHASPLVCEPSSRPSLALSMHKQVRV